jgi:integrase
METWSLQDLWKRQAQDWDIDTRAYLETALSENTLKAYGGMISRFKIFCQKHGYPTFPTSTPAIAHFFKEIAENTDRPGPNLLIASAAITAMYKGSNFKDPTQDELLPLLKKALIKANTKRPRKTTATFPVETYCNYLLTLGDNHTMTMEQLREKTLGLMALVGLFRASDLELLTRPLLTIKEEEIEITHWGGKTDQIKEGIPMTITKASDTRLCPVRTLVIYIQKTQERRAHIPNQPLFIGITSAKGIGSERIARILSDSLKRAGIDDITARSFRTTGATQAIKAGKNPDLIMKLGRWKSPEVFFKHYVNWGKESLTEAIISTKEQQKMMSDDDNDFIIRGNDDRMRN